MKYKCLECGLVFDEVDLAFWNEDRGEFWGERCYERMSGCPDCHSSDLEEVKDDEEGWDEEDDG